jgi:hypothetical protein
MFLQPGILWGHAATTALGLGPTLLGGALLLTASLALAIPLVELDRRSELNNVSTVMLDNDTGADWPLGTCFNWVTSGWARSRARDTSTGLCGK